MQRTLFLMLALVGCKASDDARRQTLLRAHLANVDAALRDGRLTDAAAARDFAHVLSTSHPDVAMADLRLIVAEVADDATRITKDNRAKVGYAAQFLLAHSSFDRSNARTVIGHTQIADGNGEKALAAYQEALKGDADAVAARISAAALLQRLERGAEGIALLQEGVTRKPKEARLLNQLGALQYRDGKLPEAEATFKTAMENGGDQTTAFNLAVVYGMQQKYQEALNLFSKILEQNPTHADALFEVGSIFDRAGEKQRALQFFQKFLDVAKDNPGQQHRMQAVVDKVKELAAAEAAPEPIASGKPEAPHQH